MSGEFSVTITAEQLSRGLRPSKRVPRNSRYLVECTGAVGRDNVLQSIDELTRIVTTEITDVFPYPQIFVLTNLIIVCSQARIYELVGGVLVWKYSAVDPIDKVVNGTFTGDTDWTKGTGWAITTVATATAGVSSYLEQDISVQAGKYYVLKYDMTRTGGAITPQIGGVAGTSRSLSGSYQDEILTTTTGNLRFLKNSVFAGTIDNVEVREVKRGSTWAVVDFFDYVYMSNGKVAVIRDATSKLYSVTTALPTASSICNFQGQVIIGAPDTAIPGASLTIKADPIVLTTEQLGTWT